MSTSKDDVLYGLKDWEHLVTDIDEVVERVVDDACEKVGEPWDVIAARIQWPIRVGVYRKMELPVAERIGLWALDHVLERLDEEYGDPDGDTTDATEAMRLTAKEFGKAIHEAYKPTVWACEPTGEVVEVTREQAREMTEPTEEGVPSQ